LAAMVLAQTAIASTFDLESFTPAELSGRYQEQSCKISLPDDCTLYLADRYDPSFMIIRSNSPGSWRAFSPQVLLRALLPDGLVPSAARVTALPKHRSDDPETFAVVSNNGSGKLQVVEQEDWSLLAWMPDLPTTPGFETVPVTLVDTDPPREL